MYSNYDFKVEKDYDLSETDHIVLETYKNFTTSDRHDNSDSLSGQVYLPFNDSRACNTFEVESQNKYFTTA